MVNNLQCNDGKENHTIDGLEYNPEVEAGDNYTIIVYTSRKMFASTYQRLSLFESNDLIGDSGSIKLGRDETIKTVFKGVMPNRDMFLNLSLQSETFGFEESCQDSKDFIIRVSDTTVDIPSQEPPYQIPPIIEPWIPPWEGWEDPGEGITDDITTTIVAVGVIAIGAMLLLKRK